MKKNTKLLAMMFTSPFIISTVYAVSSTTSSIVKTVMPLGVTSQVLNQLNISDIHIPDGNKPLKCRSLRYRTVDVKPGSDIGLHNHENSPALLGVIHGTSISYPYGHDPVTVKVGETYKEYKNVHYAKNGSKTEGLTMTTFDLMDDGTLCNGVTYPQNSPRLDRLTKTNDPIVNGAPKDSDGEKSNPIYKHKISDISFSTGSASLNARVLSIRKVTLSPGVALPHQDYTNRPAYLMVLNGKLIIATNGHKQRLRKLAMADLVNKRDALIGNYTPTKPVTYLIMEIWDSTDANTL